MLYNSRAGGTRLLAERYTTKSNVKLYGFRSQLQASHVSSHTEKLWYNETVCLGINIYMCVCVYGRTNERGNERLNGNTNWNFTIWKVSSQWNYSRGKMILPFAKLYIRYTIFFYKSECVRLILNTVFFFLIPLDFIAVFTQILSLEKMKELAHLGDVHLGFFGGLLFYQ